MNSSLTASHPSHLANLQVDRMGFGFSSLRLSELLGESFVRIIQRLEVGLPTGIRISVTLKTRVSSRNAIMPQRSCEVLFFLVFFLLYHQNGMESPRFHSCMVPD